MFARRTGIALVLGLAALGAACAPPRANVTPPATLLQAYVRAVRARDARGAYALLDEPTKARVPYEEFERLLGENRAEIELQAREIERLASDVEARAEVPLADGEVVKLVLEDGRWVIDGGILDAPALRTPEDAVRSLRRALARRSLPSLERVLARQPRADLEAEIERILDETADDLDHEVEIRGNRARVRLTGGREILLAREAGEWRIVEIR